MSWLKEEINKLKRQMKHGKGKTELIKFANGKKLTRKEAIHAMCCQCCGYWLDDIFDCQDKDCPLYEYSPYAHTNRGVIKVEG